MATAGLRNSAPHAVLGYLQWRLREHSLLTQPTSARVKLVSRTTARPQDPMGATDLSLMLKVSPLSA